MIKFIRILASVVLLLGGLATPIRAAATNQTAYEPAFAWEPEIAAFETRDKTNPPSAGAVLFIGSSSIRFWKSLPEDFPGLKVINRGFGGSQIPDSTAVAERIIFPYQPKTIVFYAGDNDLAAGKSPEKVAADFKAFVKKVHATLPETKIFFISIKPSPSRLKFKEQIIAANKAIKAMAGDQFGYIDVYSRMLDANGAPEADLFKNDGLHPTAKCYQLWAGIIRPYLQ